MTARRLSAFENPAPHHRGDNPDLEFYMNQSRIAFIGAGNMANSLIGGLLARGVPATSIHASEPSAERRQQLEQALAIHTHADNAAACAAADVVVLAVKPQIMRAVCQALAPALQPGQLVISIAAGISCASLQQWLGHQAVVRCMPNTPALLQQGISGLYAAGAVSPAQRSQATAILDAVGVSVWVDEEQQLDAVTAVSGSGPAYFFLLIEAMADAGVKLGLPAATAALLARHTALGAARMACEGDVDVATLRARVTSPQGTTDAAIRSFEADGLRSMVGRALQAAADRSAELAMELGNS